MIDWNLGDILDAIEPAVPEDAPALIHGDRIISWPEMSKRSNNLARNLRAQGHRATRVCLHLKGATNTIPKRSPFSQAHLPTLLPMGAFPYAA